MQENQNRLRRAVIRLNCCCDSHSTTRHVSCKKGSISSAARTQACSLPLLLLLLLLLLLWDLAGFRRQRQKVEGWGNSVIVLESMRICRPHDNGRATFPDFSTLRLFQKKCVFRRCVFRIRMMQYMCVFAKERCRLDGASQTLNS